MAFILFGGYKPVRDRYMGLGSAILAAACSILETPVWVPLTLLTAAIAFVSALIDALTYPLAVACQGLSSHNIDSDTHPTVAL